MIVFLYNKNTSSRSSQDGHGTGLKNLGCQFESDLRHHAGIAQLVERLLAKEKVAGPNPVSRSFFYSDPEGHLAQLVERFVYIEDVGGPSPSVAT